MNMDFFRYISSRFGRSRPKSMQLEITNHCNFNCIMCPTHCEDSTVSRPKGFMAIDQYDSICGMFKKLGGNFLIPQGAGESMLHPEFMTCLDIAKNTHRLHVGFNTNGSRFDNDIARQMIDLNIDEIGFSIDAFTPETFQRITGQNCLDKVMNAVDAMVDLRNTLGQNTPVIRVLIVEQDENRHEIKDYVNTWIDRVDEVIVQAMRVASGRKLSVPRSEPRKLCRHLFDTVFIQWDGDMTICCEDWNSEEVIGNIHSQPLEALWFSKKMRRFREMQRNRTYCPPDICLACEAWAGGRSKTMHSSRMDVVESALTTVYRRSNS
jgi:radical SAM protein with 4Fe4S-binding SPASM domain